jgi:hypothetical protein
VAQTLTSVTRARPSPASDSSEAASMGRGARAESGAATADTGAAAGVARSIFVFRQIYFTKTRATCSGTDNTGCTTTIPYRGGASSATPKLYVNLRLGDPPLPAGSTVSAKAGAVTLKIPPNCNASYSAVMTLILVDQSPCTTGYICTSSPPATVDITIVITC